MKYGTTAAERVLKRCEDRLRKQCEKLQAQMNFYESSREEVYQEALLLFFSKFEDYYENDAQYLRFLFISTKNKMINMIKQRAAWVSRFKNELPVVDDEETFASQNALEQCADPHTENKSMSTTQILSLFKSRTLRNIVCELTKANRSERRQLRKEINPRHFRIIRQVLTKHLIEQ